jgi:hypothetical protein
VERTGLRSDANLTIIRAGDPGGLVAPRWPCPALVAPRRPWSRLSSRPSAVTLLCSSSRDPERTVSGRR